MVKKRDTCYLKGKKKKECYYWCRNILFNCKVTTYQANFIYIFFWMKCVLSIKWRTNKENAKIKWLIYLFYMKEYIIMLYKYYDVVQLKPSPLNFLLKDYWSWLFLKLLHSSRIMNSFNNNVWNMMTVTTQQVLISHHSS